MRLIKFFIFFLMLISVSLASANTYPAKLKYYTGGIVNGLFDSYGESCYDNAQKIDDSGQFSLVEWWIQNGTSCYYRYKQNNTGTITAANSGMGSAYSCPQGATVSGSNCVDTCQPTEVLENGVCRPLQTCTQTAGSAAPDLFRPPKGSNTQCDGSCEITASVPKNLGDYMKYSGNCLAPSGQRILNGTDETISQGCWFNATYNGNSCGANSLSSAPASSMPTTSKECLETGGFPGQVNGNFTCAPASSVTTTGTGSASSGAAGAGTTTGTDSAIGTGGAQTQQGAGSVASGGGSSVNIDIPTDYSRESTSQAIAGSTAETATNTKDIFDEVKKQFETRPLDEVGDGNSDGSKDFDEGDYGDLRGREAQVEGYLQSISSKFGVPSGGQCSNAVINTTMFGRAASWDFTNFCNSLSPIINYLFWALVAVFGWREMGSMRASV